MLRRQNVSSGEEGNRRLYSAIYLAIGDKDAFLAGLQHNVVSVLDKQNDIDTENIDARLVKKELLRLVNSGSQYITVADEICGLGEMKQNVFIQKADRQTKRQRISAMTEFLNNQIGVISQYDDKLVRRLVERVTMFKGRVVVGFRSGAEIEIEI